MIRTLIVDDEENIRIRLKGMIQDNFPQISLIGEAFSVASAREAIESLKPELVLLDIQLDDGTAFDLLEQLPSVDFKIIFITAYDEYALKAFKFSALDYLLKPASLEDLAVSIAKAEKQILAELKLQLDSLQKNLASPRSKTLALRTAEKIYLLDVGNIVRCEADRNYTYFFVNEQKKHIVSQPMKEYEDILKEHGFVRIHKSHLVNITFIESFDKADGGYVVLKDKTQVPVSRRKKNELLELIDNL